MKVTLDSVHRSLKTKAIFLCEAVFDVKGFFFSYFSNEEYDSYDIYFLI